MPPLPRSVFMQSPATYSLRFYKVFQGCFFVPASIFLITPGDLFHSATNSIRLTTTTGLSSVPASFHSLRCFPRSSSDALPSFIVILRTRPIAVRLSPCPANSSTTSTDLIPIAISGCNSWIGINVPSAWYK